MTRKETVIKTARPVVVIIGPPRRADPVEKPVRPICFTAVPVMNMPGQFMQTKTAHLC